MTTRRRSYRVPSRAPSWLLAMALATAPATLPAQQTDGTEAAAERAYDIPAGPLDQALNAFAEQTGVTVAADGELTEGKTSPGVDGNYTRTEALQRLLDGTGLSWRQGDGNTVTLLARQGGDRLRPIQVEAAAESAYGPVDGYKADRSATALKIDAPILDTPASIEVVSQDVIEDQRATDLAQAAKNLGGVTTSSTSGNRSQNFNIRGFTATRVAKDGFLSTPTFGDRGFNDMANVARVEVLKGPASVLYGRIEPGGLINVVTKKPQAESFYATELSSGFIEKADGTHNQFRGQVDLNQPLSQDAGVFVRFNGSYQETESFRDHFIDGERALFAPTLRWTPTDRTTVDFQLEHTEQENQFDRGLVAIDGDALALPRDRFLGEAFSEFETEETRLQGIVDHRFNEVFSLRAMAQYTDIDSERFSVDPTGLRANGRTLDREVSDDETAIDEYAFQANLTAEFSTGAISHKALVGADANITQTDESFAGATLDPIDVTDPEFGAEPGTVGAADTFERDLDFYGLYFQDLVSIGRQWKVLFGGRVDLTDTFTQFNSSEVVDSTNTAFSPRGGLIYKPRPDTSLYASYTESFQPFAFTSGQGGEAFEPEQGEQIEIGVKKEWLDGRFASTLAGFQIVKQNVLTPDPNNPNRQIQTGEQESQGVEFNLQGELLPGWRVTASAAYIDAEVTEDNRIEEGNRLPNAPEWSANLWNVYAFNGGTLRGLELGGGLFFVGQREADISNSFELDSYARVDLYGAYRLTDHLKATVNVENVTDERYVSAASGPLEVEPGRPRSVFARLKLDF